MKFLYCISQVLVLSLLPAMIVYAQSDNSVTVLTPDEYTSMILGEIEVPSPSGIYQVESDRSRLDGDLPVKEPLRLVQPENLEAIPIPLEEEYAVAYLMFIKRLIARIDELGVKNSVKLYAAGYSVSEESALNIVNRILDVNNQHRELLNKMKSQNCLKFNKSMGIGEAEMAVSNFIKDEDQLKIASVDYFRTIDDEMMSAIPNHVYAHFQSVISQMSGAVKSFSVDMSGMGEDLGTRQVESVSSRCERRLYEMN